jgi:hypothetical protein
VLKPLRQIMAFINGSTPSRCLSVFIRGFIRIRGSRFFPFSVPLW